MATTDPVLLIERDGAVDRVTLNRPGRLNALDDALAAALRDYFEGLYRDRTCRVVVLRGAGRGFCAGLDLGSDMVERLLHDGVGAGLRVQYAIRDIMLAMRRCPQPIVCAMHGAAAGGGFVLGLASDIRIALRGTVMNAAFIRIGLGGCDVGASYLLPRLIGASAAAELLFTGRDLDADRALAMHLLSAVADDPAALDAAVDELVDAMLATAPEALRLTKQCFAMNLDAPSFEAALALEDRNQILLAQTADLAEGIRAFREKRPPRFEGR